MLRPGGVILAAAISRFASLIDGLKYGLLEDPTFAQIVATIWLKGNTAIPPTTPATSPPRSFTIRGELR